MIGAWENGKYDAPIVEEQFGADKLDRTILTLPQVSSLVK